MKLLLVINLTPSQADAIAADNTTDPGTSRRVKVQKLAESLTADAADAIIAG